MKLGEGKTVYKGGRKYRGECPDDLLPTAKAEPSMIADKPAADVEGKKPKK